MKKRVTFCHKTVWDSKYSLVESKGVHNRSRIQYNYRNGHQLLNRTPHHSPPLPAPYTLHPHSHFRPDGLCTIQIQIEWIGVSAYNERCNNVMAIYHVSMISKTKLGGDGGGGGAVKG